MKREDILRQINLSAEALLDEARVLASFLADLKAQGRACDDNARFTALLDGYRSAILETPTYTDGGFHSLVAAERERNIRAELLRMFTERP